MINNYCIDPSYQSRTEYHHYDDQDEEDQWQLEVYLHALGLMKKYQLGSVIDIGCGSAFKLVTYLGEYSTFGIELPANVEFLRQKYPDREWIESDISTNSSLIADVVICSDVIEHLVDPDELLNYIKTISFRYLVLSTPDRGLIHKPGTKSYFGPPRNPTHIREWTFAEFKEYISKHFNVIDHRVTNLEQFTQMIICDGDPVTV